MIRVFLAEDHETVREGLRLLINAQPDMQVIGEASDGLDTIRQMDGAHPDVVVLDLTMPGMSGLTAARALKQAPSQLAIVALTRHDDEAYVRELLAAGALAYVLKQSPSAELLKAIRAANAGKQYLDPALPGPDKPRDSYRHPTTPRITDREAEVLRMMASGHSNKEISTSLNITIKTVEVHKTNAMRKLGFQGRSDVVRYAVLNGWLKDP